MIEKPAARKIKQEIERILWDVWDPIGVNQYPAARGEYSMYVNGVFELLVTGATDNAIAEHLYRITTDRMALASTVEQMRPTVTALRAIKLGE